jgi:hypothetical protein
MIPFLPNPWESAGLPDQEVSAGQPETAQFTAPEGFRLSDLMVQALFAGRKAKNANMDALRSAKEREAAGDIADYIWEDTGWGRGRDRHWRWEISDDTSKFTRGGRTLGESLHHPELHANYDIADIPIVYNDRLPRGHAAYYQSGSGGPERIELSPHSTDDELHSNLIHEVQHVIQNREGFSPGTDPVWMRRQIARVGRLGPFGPEEALGLYNKTAGEVEAQTAAKRLNKRPADRLRVSPWNEEPIARERQIVLERARDGSTLPIPFPKPPVFFE